MAPVPGLPLESSRRPAGLPTTHVPSSAVFSSGITGRAGTPYPDGSPCPRRFASFFGGGAAQNSCARETH